jgi:hypothetical protein
LWPFRFAPFEWFSAWGKDTIKDNFYDALLFQYCQICSDSLHCRICFLVQTRGW